MRIPFLILLLCVCAPIHAQTLVPPHHRFDMTQNGQKMSAHDFEAWMQQRGLKIVGRKNTTVAPNYNTTVNTKVVPNSHVAPTKIMVPVADEKIRAAAPGTIVGF